MDTLSNIELYKKKVIPTTTTGESGTIKIVTRATYDNRLNKDEIDDTTIYFVIEDSSYANKYLSLYVGKSKQSDMISLNKMIGFTDVNSSVDLTNVFDENDIPVKDILAKEKIYYWEDYDLNVAKAYVKSSITNETLPLYGTPIWQTIESE